MSGVSDPVPLVYGARPDVPPSWITQWGAPGVAQPLPALPDVLTPWAKSDPVLPPPFVPSSAKHFDVLGADS